LNKKSMRCVGLLYSAPVRRLTAVALIGLSAAACSSKPGAADIEPFVMDELGACKLWDVSNIKKTDGVAQGDRYQIDFSAKLTFKASPAEIWEEFKRPESLASTPACNAILIALIQQPGGSFAIPEPKLRGATLSKQYAVRGSAVVVKSEQGWRLIDELKDLAFEPTS
jgi:hypothetical protein